MFELTRAEWKLLTSQIVIFEKGQGKESTQSIHKWMRVFFK